MSRTSVHEADVASAEEHLRVLHRVAQLYYLEQRTQDEIARALGVSRPSVSRLVRQAREEGLVVVSVRDPFDQGALLAGRLKSELNLHDAVVATGEWTDAEQVRQRLGHTAARYLAGTLRYGETVGMGWGRTLYEVASAIEPQGNLGLTIVPLVGGLGNVSPYFQVHELARRLSERLGGVQLGLYLPAIVDDQAARRVLLSSKDVRRVTDLWDHLSTAIVGIGNVDLGPEIRMLFADYLGAEATQRLRRDGVVGDICMRFFDAAGRPAPRGLQGVIGIELAQLRRASRRIAIAGGREKANAILGAARSGLVTHLITDELAARQVLELAAEAKARS
jgi:DNA-binding transcriptional regulator LsrR (DeoR family)